MSLENLQPGGLYVLLFIRSDPPKPDDYHWALYLHRNPNTGGTKYHIKNQGSGWITDHGPNAGVFKSFLLVGLFQIAVVPSGLESYVDKQLRTYDSSLNAPETTCLVWVLWVLKLLQQPVNECRILNCDDLDELEKETKEWGNEHAGSAAANVQPRPVGRSKILDL